MIRSLVMISIGAAFSVSALAQDTLPRFSVVAKPGNRNVISWTNSYRTTKQISIQRSTDSLKNFKTIITVPDPTVPQNGFVDAKAPAGNNFYRVFIVLDSGKYQFTASRKPAPDTATVNNEPVLQDNQRVVLSDSLSTGEVTALREKLKPENPRVPKPEKFFIVKKRDTIIRSIPERLIKRFRDSIVYATKDTLLFADVDTILIKPFVPKEVYKASKYVFTEKSGNVMVSLPEAGRKKYSLKFFEENKRELFEIPEVESRSVVIDKTNFVHSGWFWFELYEDGQLKERHRLFLPRDY